MKKRYCPMCDDMVYGSLCPKCGADTDRWPIDPEPLEPSSSPLRGREADAFDRETSARIQRELK